MIRKTRMVKKMEKKKKNLAYESVEPLLSSVHESRIMALIIYYEEKRKHCYNFDS